MQYYVRAVYARLKGLIMSNGEKVAMAIIAPIGAFMLYTLFIWMPVNIVHEARCLKAGFPEYKTTVFLDGYCINLDGDITGVVVPASERNTK